MWPRLGTTPHEGFRPYTPQKWAGARIDPPMSLPSSRGVMPAATAAAAPPEDPPVRALEVPRVVRLAEHIVECLVVAGVDRGVGLADDDRAGGAEAGHGDGIVFGYVIAQLGRARGGDETLGLPDVLHRHDQTVQRTE